MMLHQITAPATLNGHRDRLAPRPRSSAEARLRALSDDLQHLAAEYDSVRDPRAITTYCLARMQRALADEIERGVATFEDPDWVADLAIDLHKRWMDACRAYDERSSKLPAPYRRVFDEVRNKPVTVLDAVLLPLSAHIVHDLPLTLLHLGVDASAAHLADFDAINASLARQIRNVVHGVQRIYDPLDFPLLRWLDRLGGSFDRILIDGGFRLGRAWAWYVAARLANPIHRPAAMREIEQAPIGVMRLVRNPPLWWPLRQAYRMVHFFLARAPFRWPKRATARAPMVQMAARRWWAPRARFVDRWDYAVSSFLADGVSSFGFLVEGDIEALRRYCNRYFFDPSGGNVNLEPASPYVLVQFSTTERQRGPDGLYPDVGPQDEVSFVFFANDQRNRGAFVAVAPYIVVDNPISASQAHEVFGLPKEFGRLERESSGDDPQRLSASVLSVPDTNAPEARFDWHRLVQIDRVDDDPNASPIDDLDSLVKTIGDVIGASTFALQLLPTLVSGESTILSLKQFKDVSSSAIACHQTVTATRMRMTKQRDVRHLAGRYELRVADDLATHPIASELGLHGPRPVVLGFSLGYDLELTGNDWL